MNVLVSPKSASAYVVNGRPLVRTVIVGHVDHGKSTLIGRLLHETGNIPDGKLDLDQSRQRTARHAVRVVIPARRAANRA